MAAKPSWHAKSVRRALLDEDLEATRPFMQGRVLEIGAGRNHRRGNFIPSITDDWIFLDLGQKNSPDVQGDVCRLPLTAASFDAIVCLEVLEYIAESSKALAEFQRTLKAGGQLVLTVPFVHRQDSPSDYWRFTEAGLVHLLEATGFQILQIKNQGRIYGAIASMIRTVVIETKTTGLSARILFSLVEWLLKKDGRVSIDSSLAKISTGTLIVAKKP